MSRIIRFLLGKIYYWIFVFSIAQPPLHLLLPTITKMSFSLSAFCLFSRFSLNFHYMPKILLEFSCNILLRDLLERGESFQLIGTYSLFLMT
jgi:hypothetical protein